MEAEPEIRRMNLEDLHPAQYNPREISDEAYAGLGESMERFGVLSLIVWNEYTGNIVGGHQRYKKLVADGETETDVVVVNLNEQDEVALNIALNNRQMRGDFTQEAMQQLAQVEAKLGSTFNDLNLNDLHKRLQNVKWEKSEKKDNKQDDDDDDNDMDGSSTTDDNQSDDDDEGPDTIITCPECASMWRMKDEKVIYDGKSNSLDS